MKTNILVLVFSVLVNLVAFNQGRAGSFENKIKNKLDRGVKELKEKIDKFGESREEVQDYLNNYDWKGIIQNKASSDGVTLKNLKLNGHKKVAVVSPGEIVQASVTCDLDPAQCSALKLYRVVIGLKGKGAQTTIGNELGVLARKSHETFQLKAPEKPGIYQVRFRLVESYREEPALEEWEDEDGKEPDAKTTIGVLAVKE